MTLRANIKTDPARAENFEFARVQAEADGPTKEVGYV